MVIDSHQHFWHYEPVKHGWIDDAMKCIRRDFLPAELELVYRDHGVSGSVVVEADQSETETHFLLEQATQYPFIKGVVGFTDLRAADVSERLDYFSHFPLVKGFRHVLQSQDPAFMLQEKFLQGISMLKNYGFTYDILVFPKQLNAVKELLKQHPDQPFVIDHIAKPYIKAGAIDEWASDMQALAAFPNLYCKISGMVTEADYDHWKPEQFTPYMDVVVNAFGTDRIMYGSDWPVCLVAAQYGQVLSLVKNYFASFSADEQSAFFSGNASRFYHL